MATIKKIERNKKWGKRPTGNAIDNGKVWFVEKGEPYDLVNFYINELDKGYSWRESLCVPCNWTDEQVKEQATAYAKNIDDKEIIGYRWFLEDGEKWGWD